MAPLRYLSLFTGIGTAELAIRTVFPDAICMGYSEIDADALSIYRHHFPHHENLGDVTQIDGKKLNGKIDLVIGGSPCQAFSKMGQNRGFDDPRAQLFFHYKRLLQETGAIWFVFENVNSMKPAIRGFISKELGVEPVMLDASTFTPQVRRRLFWTNFPISPPVTVCTHLKHVLLPKTDMKDLSNNWIRGVSLKSLLEETPTRTDVFAITLRGPYDKGVKRRTDGKANTVTTILNDLQIVYDGKIFRRLDCVEAERLQGIPDGHTEMLPRVRRYKCIGNAFCLPVVLHIMQCLRNHRTSNYRNV